MSITKDKIFELLAASGSRRKQFSLHSGIQKRKGPSSPPTFSVSFDNGLCEHFYNGTGLRLSYNNTYQQFYCFLRTPEDMAKAEAWELAQGTRVFIRNCLKSTVALDANFSDNIGTRTQVGSLEYEAKTNGSHAAIETLADLCAAAVSSIAYLSHADYVCAVPALKTKHFDLPRTLAGSLAEIVGKTDITSKLEIAGKTKSLKECTLEEKWEIWSKCTVNYGGPKLLGKRILLVDDKYQSGITLQYVAKVLLELGASEVHGLCLVKTLRDDDNIDVVDD